MRLNFFPCRLPKLPMAWYLSIILSLVIVVATFLVGMTAFIHGDKAVSEMVQSLMRQTALHIMDQIANASDDAFENNTSNKMLIDFGLIDIHDTESWMKLLLRNAQSFKFCTSFSLGVSDGHYVSVDRRDDGEFFLRRSDDSTGHQFVTMTTETPPRIVGAVPNYDSRTRPWYKAAAESGKPVWSDVYMRVNSPTLQIAACTPVFGSGNEILGVIFCGIRLSHWSSLLRRMDMGSNGFSFIVDRSGLLIATSVGEPFILTGNGQSAERIRPEQSPSPSLRACGEFLKGLKIDWRTIDHSVTYVYSIGSKGYHLDIQPYHDARGLDWLIVLNTCDDDFLKTIQRGELKAVGVCASVLVVAIFLAITIGRWLVGTPLAALEQAALDLSSGRECHFPEKTACREVASLKSSFASMASQIGTRTREAEDALSLLRESEARFRSIYESSMDAIIQYHVDNGVVGANPSTLRLFGCEDESQIIGRTMVDFSPEFQPDGGTSAEKSVEIINEVLKNGSSFFEWVHKRLDGIEFHTVAQFVRMDVHGFPDMIQATLRDISAQKKADAELAIALHDAHAANEAKSNFLANMSHEIRTPLNGVLGMVSLLRETNLDERQSECVNVAISSGETLLDVINRILDFSRIESCKIDIEKIDFDLESVVEEIEDSLAFRAQQKGLEFIVDLDPAMPTELCGDPLRLKQVLMNLVANAIKFTESGEVSISARVESDSPKTILLRFVVSDTGIGIPAAQMSDIFDPFVQVEPSTTRRFGGTGLGLAISKRLAENMGGRITLSSVESRGTVFTVSIPFEKTLPPSPPPASSAELNLNGLRTMIVDDNASFRRVAAARLAAFGCRVDSAGGMDEALNLIKKADEAGDSIHVLLIDADLPRNEGLDLSAMLNSGASAPKPSTLALVKLDCRESTSFSKAGFNAWLTKPLKKGRLAACLLEFASRIPSAKTNSNATSQRMLFNARILLVEDEISNQMVEVQIISEFGCSVDVASDGAVGLRKLAAESYDIVFLDCQMPNLDGFGLTRAIRTLSMPMETGHDVPVIAVTAYALEGDREKCLAAGMSDYLAKPIQRKDFESMLLKWIPERKTS